MSDGGYWDGEGIREEDEGGSLRGTIRGRGGGSISGTIRDEGGSESSFLWWRKIGSDLSC